MVDLDDLSLDYFSDDDSDSEEEEDDDDTEYQIYTDKALSKDYILKYRNTSLYEPIMLPHYTGPAKKLCHHVEVKIDHLLYKRRYIKNIIKNVKYFKNINTACLNSDLIIWMKIK